MLQQAYSLLRVKAVDAERRIITGTATTPATDRVGDIVEPLGVTFKNPLPLLLYHNSQKPVGSVRFKKPTEDGIDFEAILPIVDEPGTVRDRIEEAWQSIKAGLLTGVSIGFRAIELSFMQETGGIRFLATEVLELSLVAIPANSEATIHTIKAIDLRDQAASGRGPTTKQAGTPGVQGTVIRLATKGATTPMTIQDQIKAIVASRGEKDAQRTELMRVANEKGETLDAQGEETFDTLTGEITKMDAHLVRLRLMEKSNQDAAAPVVAKTAAEASLARTPAASTTAVSVKSPMDGSLEFCAMVLCKAHAFLEVHRGNFVSAIDIAKKRYPDNNRIHSYLEFQQKAAVAGGTTTDANYASALLAQAQTLESAFIEWLRPRTIVGKFGQNGIPSLNRVPFNVKIASQTSGASAAWVGEGKAKPVTKFNTTSTTMLFTKIAAICVITDELARFSSPGAENVVRNELTRAVGERMDRDFIDPDKAASSGVNPASITNGVTPTTGPAGVSAANALTDLQNLISPFVTNNYDVSDLVIIMPNSLALVLSLMLNSLGQRAFPDITIDGGRLAGLPVITSQYAGMGSSYGNMIIVVSASNIALADDGKVTVDASREASIEMSDAPGQDATVGTGASLVSMFQTNSIALRAEREINWKKLRSNAVTFMDDVNWGSVGSPY